MDVFWLDLTKSPALSAFIGGATGIAGGILNNYYAFHREKKQKAKSTLEALKAEVNSILKLIEHANYAGGMRGQMNKVRATGKPHFFFVPVKIELFTRVYSANVGNLGILESRFISPIVIFYASVNALVMNLEHTKMQPDYSGLAENLIYIYEASIERLSIAVSIGETIIEFK